MSTQLRAGEAILDLQKIAALRTHPGWELFVRQWTTEFNRLTAEALDVKKPASEAEILRQARGRIERDFSPEKIVENLLAKNNRAAEQGAQMARQT